MSYPYYIVDAFAEEVFKGNPAAVYVLEKWLPEAVMQNIAIENNLSETAFTVKEGQSYALRWFTPEREIDLCGHATLATAFVLFNYYSVAEETLHFTSQSGPLAVTKKEEYYYLDFPYILPERIPILPEYEAALGTKIYEAYLGRDLFFVLKDEETVAKITPDFSALKALDLGVGVIVTASGDSVDFVSRTFFPKLRINEARQFNSLLGKTAQSNDPFGLSSVPRGGFLTCEVKEDRVIIGGTAKLFAKGEAYLPV